MGRIRCACYHLRSGKPFSHNINLNLYVFVPGFSIFYKNQSLLFLSCRPPFYPYQQYQLYILCLLSYVVSTILIYRRRKSRLFKYHILHLFLISSLCCSYYGDNADGSSDFLFSSRMSKSCIRAESTFGRCV